MKRKLILGVIIVLVLSLGSIVLFAKRNLNNTGDDTMTQMDMSNDSMDQTDTDNHSSVENMDMDNDSMVEMDMGQSDRKITGYTNINLDARKQQLIGVKIDIVKKRALVKAIRAYGIISHDTELYAAQQEYLSAYRYYRSMAGGEGLDTAKVMLEAAQRKLAILGYGNAQIESLIARGRTDDSLIGGGNSTQTWIYAQIYPNDLPYVNRGQRVKIYSPQLPGKTFNGMIDSMDTLASPENQSVRARILVKNIAAALFHEGYVNVEVQVPLGIVPALPEEAVIDSGGRQIAFVKTGKGYFEPRELRLGRHAEGYHEVISGVTTGERVVSSASFFIDSESQLKATLGNMSSHQHK